ncbi:MAG: ribonuclease HI [Clostridiales bacterium]|nr:ribonuclease HI [Clostridiales bacterium]
MKEVIIYTDGACSGNPGPGGYGAVLRYGSHEKEISGGERQTTNQRMEMQAAIAALEQLSEPCHVLLHSDSAYLVNAFIQNWFGKWQSNGWLNSKKQPVENRDLWEKLLVLAGKHQIEWVKVKGHADDELNNRCDQLARDAVPR